MDTQTASTKTPSRASNVVKVSDKYQNSIAALRCLIDGDVIETLIPARGDKPERTKYEQLMIIVGGPRQLNTNITFFDRTRAMLEGCYTLSNDSLRLNQYGRIEVVTFPENFVRIRDMSDEEKGLFQQSTTALDDFL